MSRFEAVTAPDAVSILPMREMRAADLEERKAFECVFCKQKFASLPFFGCCVDCYTLNDEARALVEESTPQTVAV